MPYLRLANSVSTHAAVANTLWRQKILEVLQKGQQRRIIRYISLPNGDILLVDLNSATIKDEIG